MYIDYPYYHVVAKTCRLSNVGAIGLPWSKAISEDVLMEYVGLWKGILAKVTII